MRGFLLAAPRLAAARTLMTATCAVCAGPIEQRLGRGRPRRYCLRHGPRRGSPRYCRCGARLGSRGRRCPPCQTIRRRASSRRRVTRLWQVRRRSFMCPNCGQMVSRTPQNYRPRVFCSRRCTRAFHSSRTGYRFVLSALTPRERDSLVPALVALRQARRVISLQTTTNAERRSQCQTWIKRVDRAVCN